MALIDCPECNSQMSDKAAACPKCGSPPPGGSAAPPPGAGAPRGYFCRSCGGSVHEAAVVCTSCGCPPGAPGKHCYACASEVPSAAVMCVKCGASLADAVPARASSGRIATPKPAQPQSKIVCGLLALFMPFGIHRFLMGYSGLGVAQLCLALFLGIGVFWSWIDGILILTGSLKMADGQDLV